MKLKITTIILLLSSSLIGNVHADFNTGWDLFKQGD